SAQIRPPRQKAPCCSLTNFHWARLWAVFPKYLSNHIQCCDWRGARPHLELIAADATQHTETGCWGSAGDESHETRDQHLSFQAIGTVTVGNVRLIRIFTTHSCYCSDWGEEFQISHLLSSEENNKQQNE
ncbi:hypothetical protein FQN60_018229, partial [Etheostoma spectabile]